MKPSVSVPAIPSATLRTASAASSAWASTSRACGSSAFPASVSDAPRLLRSNRGAPKSSSSLRICSLSAGCETCKCAAARLKLRCCATATNERRSRNSIGLPSAYDRQPIFPIPQSPPYHEKTPHQRATPKVTLSLSKGEPARVTPNVTLSLSKGEPVEG